MRLLLAFLVALTLAPSALAEVVVPHRVDDAELGVAPDGWPRVAYVADGVLTVLARRSSGWSATGNVTLPGAGAAVVRVAATRSATFVLAEGVEGDWLELVRLTPDGPSVRLRLTSGASTLGPAGLTLDRRGRPVVAWATDDGDDRTALRLWHQGQPTEQITRRGFPGSDIPPPVAPIVMRNGSVRVVEAYAVPTETGAIEWSRSRGKWVGQYVFAGAVGSPTGVLRADASGSTTYAAWTHVYPTLGEVHIVVTRNARGRQTSRIVAPHAALVDLALTGSGFEVAANDWIDTNAFGIDADPIEAALVFTSTGAAHELDGRLFGYAARARRRQFLLERDGALEWFAAAALPSATVTATAAKTGSTVTVTGTANDATSVTVYRETPDERVAVDTAAVGSDGTFSVIDANPALPAAYRAVAVDATGVPVAQLVRDVVAG